MYDIKLCYISLKVTEAIPRKNQLQFGQCPKGVGGGYLTWIHIVQGSFFLIALYSAKFLVGVLENKKKGGGGQGNFNNVQIEADFFLGIASLIQPRKLCFYCVFNFAKNVLADDTDLWMFCCLKFPGGASE